jgi:serralysin
MPSHDLCVDAYPPGERFDAADLPRLPDFFRATSEELAVAWRRQWQPGQELRVRFLDGDPALRRRVRAQAETWLEWANLGFVFGDHPTAEIRVTFTGNGYWSHVGTDAMRVDPDAPTMQLGGFTRDTDEVVLRRTVLHEFGHAIGCIHEQASPAAHIAWDVEKVFAFYREWQGWDRPTTYANVLERYSNDELCFTVHDPESIMQYPVPETLTRDGFSIGWNNDLSSGDCSFIARMYPAPIGERP